MAIHEFSLLKDIFKQLNTVLVSGRGVLDHRKFVKGFSMKICS